MAEPAQLTRKRSSTIASDRIGFMSKNEKEHPRRISQLLTVLISCLVAFSVCLACSIANAGSQNKVLDDSPPPTLIDVEFLRSQVGFVIGRAGILKTLDGGKHWSRSGPIIAINEEVAPSALAVLTPIFRLDFVNEKHGWAQRADGLLRTTDGGQTWELLVGWERPADEAFNNFSFYDEKSGWALFKDGSVRHSSDGGKTWVMQTTFVEGKVVQATSSSECWVVGDRGKTLRTADGGSTWVASSVTPTDDLIDLALIDGKEIWVLSLQTSYHSEDSGKTWQPLVRAPSNSPMFRSIRFASRLKGWMVGDNGSILHTRDGGRTWSNQKSGTKENLKRISVVDEDTAWVIGDSVLLRTSDGGRTWFRQKLPNSIVRNQ